MIEYLTAILLGFVEGLTEFIPVSSTGHLILLIEGLKFPAPPGHVFEVFIQIGAILAVMVLYRQKIIQTVLGLHSDPTARRFATNVLIGTLPAIALGAVFYTFIKDLYDPMVIGASLILGGLIILLFDKKFTNPHTQTIDDITPRQALLIGMCQSIALIPGVSRSGATIMGSLALGLTRKAAAEFSFFLAMPIMICAVTFDVYKNWDALIESQQHINLMLAGLAASFVTALVVVKAVIGLITKYGFTPFAWYRIALGLLVFVIFW